MGTHPIFESDFDCLTDYKSALNKMPSPQEQKSSKMQEKPSLTLNNSSHRIWSSRKQRRCRPQGTIEGTLLQERPRIRRWIWSQGYCHLCSIPTTQVMAKDSTEGCP